MICSHPPTPGIYLKKFFVLGKSSLYKVTLRSTYAWGLGEAKKKKKKTAQEQMRRKDREEQLFQTNLSSIHQIGLGSKVKSVS